MRRSSRVLSASSALFAFVPAVALAVLLSGCSHKPKPVAVIPDVQAATRDTLKPDTTTMANGTELPDSSTAGAAASAPRKVAKANTEPKAGVQTGASSSAAPGPANAAGSGGAAGAAGTAAADTLRKRNEPLAPILPESAEITLQRETRKAVDEARTRLSKLDEKKLDEDQRKKLKIASDFVVEAERALERKEYERAAGLATKARLLSEELSPG
ncbi:MAG: hypothetical protein ACREOU_08635 [Candidatus Eiseniibacteriota bacterium]